MIINKIKRKLSYEKYDMVIYDYKLKEAYSGKSVSGGSLKDKSVLITGGSGDIGIALAIRYLDEGCKVILAGRSEQKLDDAITQILSRRKDCDLDKLIFDMMDKKTIDKAMDYLSEKKEKIDILVLNAGFFGKDDRDGVFRTYKREDFLTSWRTNYIGVTYLCERMANYMEHSKSDEKKIVLISSICAKQKKFRYTPYGMSKAASTEFVNALRESHPSISMSVIFPGSVATKMGNIKIGDNIAKKCNKLNRVIIPEEIAALSAFLSSESGRFVKNGVVASACEVL